MITTATELYIEIGSVLKAASPGRAAELIADTLNAIALGLADDPVAMAREALALVPMIEGALEGRDDGLGDYADQFEDDDDDTDDGGD